MELEEEVIQDVPYVGVADEIKERVSDRTAFYDLKKRVLEYLVDRSLHFKARCTLQGDVLSFEVEVFNEAPVGTIHYSRNRVY